VPFDPLAEYLAGLVGCSSTPEDKAEFDAWVSGQGLYPYAADAIASHGLEGSGAGKLTALWVYMERLFPGCLPGAAQTRGDCFPAGTLVSMADGTTKTIESVVEGDLVVSHVGKTRRVTATIKKPFDGHLVEIRAECSDQPVAATPDHRFVVVDDSGTTWKAIGGLTVGDVVVHREESPIVSWDSGPFVGDVYCLEVEEDHSFIANGYAVHNCVSHSTRTAAVCTMCCEIAAGRPDEVTGEIEDKPEMPVEGYRDVICSSEVVYFYRRHGGDGWQCGASAKVMCTESGLWPRKNYPEFGFDLTRYSGKLAGKYGATPPPENITAFGRQHLMRTATRCETFEQVRDLLANGFALTTCGGQGWSSTRDENGASRRQGGWSHALAVLGADDRDIIKEKYGEPLVHVQNSWNLWNGGPRRVLGTNIDIPEGSFWSRWSDFQNREMIAFSGFNGWPAQRLPNWVGDIF
jgi:hypothetical protein